MALLLADLRALANLPRDAGGRRAATHGLVLLAMLAMMSWWIARRVLADPYLLHIANRSGNDPFQGLCGLALMACPMAAVWIGLSTAQRQLFETPELDLWQTLPIAPWRGGLQVLLRAAFFALLWAAVMVLPFALVLLANAGAPPIAYAMLPLAIAGATLPTMALLLLVQIAMVRLFAGRVLRLVMLALTALASVGVSVWLLLTLFWTGERAHEFVTGVTTTDTQPWSVAAGAELLACAATGRDWTPALRALGGWMLFAAAAAWFGARLHPGALMAHRLAEPRRRATRSRWPAGVAAVLRRKEFAQVVQQPGALIGFLVFGVLVFALVEKQAAVGAILAQTRMPLELRHLTALCAWWFLAVVLVLYPHMGRLVLWDARQWSLYAMAPATPAAILRGKLGATGILLVWPLLLVGVFGGRALGTDAVSLLQFVGIAVPGTLVALGVLAVVGTLPWLVRPDDAAQTAQGGRNFFASLLLILFFELVMAPGVVAWLWLAEWAQHDRLTIELCDAYAPHVIAIAWAFGLTVFALGLLIGARNFRKLTRPV